MDMIAEQLDNLKLNETEFILNDFELLTTVGKNITYLKEQDHLGEYD